jgi:CheY-like chemotaxis protein
VSTAGGAGRARILLVEDNPACVELTREAFAECGHPDCLDVVYDGEEAMDFLRRQGLYADARRPGLIILDLNLPGKDGREVLAEIKADERLRHIPVLIFTTSDADRDIAASYDLYANCYIVKPFSLDAFFATVSLIERFWLRVVKLPKVGPNEQNYPDPTHRG